MNAYTVIQNKVRSQYAGINSEGWVGLAFLNTGPGNAQAEGMSKVGCLVRQINKKEIRRKKTMSNEIDRKNRTLLTGDLTRTRKIFSK